MFFTKKNVLEKKFNMEGPKKIYKTNESFISPIKILGFLTDINNFFAEYEFMEKSTRVNLKLLEKKENCISIVFYLLITYFLGLD